MNKFGFGHVTDWIGDSLYEYNDDELRLIACNSTRINIDAFCWIHLQHGGVHAMSRCKTVLYEDLILCYLINKSPAYFELITEKNEETLSSTNWWSPTATSMNLTLYNIQQRIFDADG
jgi:hypothetical protein